MNDRSEEKGLRKAVLRPAMPTYINRQGVETRAYNTLTEERELELRNHVDECDAPLQQCPECWLLYCSVGQEEYVKVLTRDL